MTNKNLTPLRKIEQGRITLSSIEIDRPDADWLLAQAGEDERWQLLAFADDGLIWGRVENAELFLSGEAFSDISPPLRVETLQEARLFNQTAQLHLWRSNGGWQARRIIDGQGDAVEYYDEAQILWGNTLQAVEQGFTRLSDGLRGFQHAPPLRFDNANFKKKRPLRLIVRHYLSKDEKSGLVGVTLSRLVNVEVQL